METDLIKIHNFAKENENENYNFRIFLKDYDEEKLDSIVHRLFKQVLVRIDCTTCGNCCRNIRPILTEKDIMKLSKAMHITPEQFMKRYVEKDEDGDDTFEHIPCLFLSNNKCTQYEARPRDCVSYPHLHKKGFVFRLLNVINNYSICPIVFNVYEALKSELRSDYSMYQDENDDLLYY